MSRTTAPLTLLSLILIAACGSDPEPGPSGSTGGSPGVGGASGGSASGGEPGSGGTGAMLMPSGGSDPGTGGMSEAGGTDPGSGGSGGGQTGGDGGSGGTGGTGASVCPSGSEALAPVLTGKMLSDPIAGVPDAAVGGFLEGPVWRDGKLYLSQLEFTSPINEGDILAYTPGSGFEVFIPDVGTNGLALHPDGRLIAASQGSAGVIAFDPDNPSAAAEDIARMYNGATFNSPNDVTVRSDGTVYFSDPNGNCGNCMNQPVQGVYRVTPTGTVELLNTTQSPPNGVALSPDESTLYVGGATLTAHPVMADGSVGAGTPFGNNLSGTDGFAIDCAGHVYVALHNEGMVIVLDKDGNQLDGNFSVSQVTNMAFGGPENRTLFVTSFGDNKGQLRSVELEVPGYPF